MATTPLRARFARSFTQERLADLLKVCDDLERTFELPGGGVPERLFFRAYFQTMFDTGMSQRQLLALQWRAIQPTGQIPVEFCLSREALILIARMVSPCRPNVFALPEGYDLAGRLGLIRSFADFEAQSRRKGGEL